MLGPDALDHTLLRPETTATDVMRWCEEGVDLGVGGFCTWPRWMRFCRANLPAGMRLVAVANFPSGAAVPSTTIAEAMRAVEDGADEVDVVAPLGVVAERDLFALDRELRTLRDGCPGVFLRLITESALWHDREQLATVCRVAADCGFDAVKTSTGMHPAGGASIGDVLTMRASCPLPVKASGGIRDWQTARSLANAGASRLGVSASAHIVAGAVHAGDWPA